MNLKKNINEKISELETGIGELSDKHYSEIVSVREALEIEAKPKKPLNRIPTIMATIEPGSIAFASI